MKKRTLKCLFGSAIILIAAIILCLRLMPAKVHAINDGLADKPPMGWNCYHWFGCAPTESMIKQAADSIVSSGLKAAGYIYVNMDDGWMASSRDGNGNLVPNSGRFPNGLKSLTDYIHSKGLKAGIYLTCGQKTYQELPGSLGYEQKDANQIAAWGFDFLKYDYRTMSGDPPRDCKAENITMSNALRYTGRPILFSMCEHGRSSPWTWAADYAHMWRISTDIKDCWDGEFSGGWGFNKIVNDKDAGIYSYAGPGHWNDPDMTIVGLHGRQSWMGPGCTDTEYRAHFSLWCLLAAPLILGIDPSNMDQATRDIVLNTEIIAVDQDVLGKQAQRVRSTNGNLDVWVKQMQNNAWAVGLHNRSGSAANITVYWSDLGLSSGTSALVRDLWAKSDQGNYTDHYTRNVASHDCVVIKISTGSGPTPTPGGVTKFGTGPAYAPGTEYDKATDGNTSTYFDYVNANGGYTGLDYGAGNAKVITKIRYYPRANWAGRMVGGKLQGSNTSTTSGYTDFYTITATPPYAWTEVNISNPTAYRYVRYLSPDGGYCNIAEADFVSGGSATPTPTPAATPTPTPVVIKVEAETGTLNGTTVSTGRSGYSGTGFVTGFDNTGDAVTVTVNVPSAGNRNLKIGYAIETGWGDKKNYVYVNGVSLGEINFVNSNGVFTECIVGSTAFNQGNNTIKVEKSWGWFDVDYVKVE